MVKKILTVLYYLATIALLTIVAIAFFKDDFQFVLSHKGPFSILFLVWWALLYMVYLRGWRRRPYAHLAENQLLEKKIEK